MLIDHLGIDTLFRVAGGSMGGMQVLQWAASHPAAGILWPCANRHSCKTFRTKYRLSRSWSTSSYGGS